MRLPASSRSAFASLGPLAAVLLAAVATPARAAEVTRVASRGEPGNPFQLHLSVRWDRLQERAQLSREDLTGGRGDELRYSRSVTSVVPRIAIALAEDLDVHFEWPYVLRDDRSWRFGMYRGAPTGGGSVGVGPLSSIESNAIDAGGNPCPGAPCPLFPVAPSTTVYRGGRSGDLVTGLAWGIFNDRKDPTKPYWLVGLDVTLPTAALDDPAADRGTDWSSPWVLRTNPGPFGEKVWRWDLHTVLSRRVGPIDPYLKAHLTLLTKSSSTYSNCDHAQALAVASPAVPVPQLNAQAPAACLAGGADARAKLPWIAGLTLGTELVPFERSADGQKVSLDLRLWGDYTSSARFYNELTDASGKLHWTDEYLTVGAFLGLYFRTSRWLSFHATAALSTKTDHLVTGETLGRNRGDPSVAEVTADPSLVNPNFDWRYDAPGRRFRLSEVALLDVQLGALLQF
jgi:hypothetical protein